MEDIKAALPPTAFHTVSTWVVDSTDELADLRGSVFEALTGTEYVSGASLADPSEKLVLVTSELATNALRHGKPPTIVTVMSNGDEHLLDVADHDTTTVPAVASPRQPGKGGFGLVLAHLLASDVGWYRTATTKHIWARFPAQLPAS